MYTEHTLASSNVKYVLTNSPTTNSLHACMLVLSQLVVSYCTKNGYANTTLEQLCIVLQYSTSSYYYYSSQYAYYYQQYQYIHVVVTATTRYYQQLHAYDTITTLEQQQYYSSQYGYYVYYSIMHRVRILSTSYAQKYQLEYAYARVLARSSTMLLLKQLEYQLVLYELVVVICILCIIYIYI